MSTGFKQNTSYFDDLLNFVPSDFVFLVYEMCILHDAI